MKSVSVVLENCQSWHLRLCASPSSISSFCLCGVPIRNSHRDSYSGPSALLLRCQQAIHHAGRFARDWRQQVAVSRIPVLHPGQRSSADRMVLPPIAQIRSKRCGKRWTNRSATRTVTRPVYLTGPLVGLQGFTGRSTRFDAVDPVKQIEHDCAAEDAGGRFGTQAI